MPYDDPNSWISEDLLKQQQDLARQFGRTPQATSPFGALAQGLGGIFGGLANTNVAAGLEQNQNVMADAMRKAAGAKSTADLSGILMSSGIPQLGVRGMDFKASGLQRQEEQNSPQALANLQRTRMGIAQLRREIEQAKLTDPLKVRQLQAQIDELEGKGGITGLVSKILKGEPDAALSPNAAPVAPPTARPMSNEAPSAADPNLIRVQATTAPQAPAKVPEQGVMDILRSKSRAEREAWALMLSKEPKRAMELLQQWVEPKINKTTEHDLDKALMGAINATSRLTQVQKEFKPEYLQAGSQANLNFTALRDKYLSGKLKPGPQELAKLNDYAKWRSTAWEELNSYIKDLAGSAVTGNELERTLNARPNPGTGWFDGDSPQQYAAKMDATLRNGKAAIARFRYLREKGLLNAGETMAKREDLGAQFPLEKMGNIIDQEGAAVLERLKRENPGVPDQQLLPRAMDEVSKRFGLAI